MRCSGSTFRAIQIGIGAARLFGGGSAPAAAPFELRDAAPWSEEERLASEYAMLGFYVSGHPDRNRGSTAFRRRFSAGGGAIRVARRGALERGRAASERICDARVLRFGPSRSESGQHGFSAAVQRRRRRHSSCETRRLGARKSG